MNKIDNPRKALGKGLSALLPTRTPTAPPPASPPPPADDAVQTLPVDAIDPNPLQPRRLFQNERMAELAQSIRANGIVQPLVVRRMGDRYQLVAGERRWRAAKLAEVRDVPVVVREIPDERLLEISLIENIQREDLNPMETAHAFARLTAELELSPEQIGQRTDHGDALELGLVEGQKPVTILQQDDGFLRGLQGDGAMLRAVDDGG